MTTTPSLYPPFCPPPVTQSSSLNPPTGEKGHEVMLREISLPVHSSEYLIRAFLPVDYPQLTNIAGQRNTGINYVESRWFREGVFSPDSSEREERPREDCHF